MKKLLLATLALGLAGTACRKKHDPAPTQPRPDLLTAHEWKRAGALLAVTGVPIPLDVFGALPACQKDDIIKFNTDQTAYVKVNQPCTDETNRTVAWAFAAGDAKLTVTDPADKTLNGTFDIVELTEGSLKVSGIYSDSSVTGTVVLSFSRP